MKNLNENADGRDIEKLLSKVKELENMIKELKDNENSQKDLLNNSLKSINKKCTTLQQVESTKEKDFMIISVELASSPFTPKFAFQRSIQDNKSIIRDKPAVVLNEIDSSNSYLRQKK